MTDEDDAKERLPERSWRDNRWASPALRLIPWVGSLVDLPDDWNRVQGNIRLFTHTNHEFGGAAPTPGDWTLLSSQSFDADPQGSLLHEWLHVSGMSTIRMLRLSLSPTS